MKLALIRKILKTQLEIANSNLAEFAQNEFKITYTALVKKFAGETKFRFEEIEKIVKYCNGQVKYEDFEKRQDTTSTDKNNTNNVKNNVKNSASEVGNPDLKNNDVG